MLYAFDKYRKVNFRFRTPRDSNSFIYQLITQAHFGKDIAWSIATGIASRAIGESIFSLKRDEQAFCINTIKADIDCV